MAKIKPTSDSIGNTGNSSKVYEHKKQPEAIADSKIKSLTFEQLIKSVGKTNFKDKTVVLDEETNFELVVISRKLGIPVQELVNNIIVNMFNLFDFDIKNFLNK